MKAIVCDRPGSFTYKEKKSPLPKKGEAIVRIKQVGICGTDIHAYRGNQPFIQYPRILGHELAGIVENIDDKVIKRGDQVSIIPYLHCGKCIACKSGKTNCCVKMKVLGVHVDGGMCERIAVPISNLIKTNGLSLDATTVIEPLSIGAHAVRRSSITSNKTALVIGAGPIGLGVMAFAKQEGARVIAMDIDENRLKFCRKWAKVDETINALHSPSEAIKLVTNGEMPTIVFDATGDKRSMQDSFRFVAHGGELVFVGLVREDIVFSDPSFHEKEISLLASRNATKKDFLHVLQVIRNGNIAVGQYITHRSKFEEVDSNFQKWLQPESKVIKAIVEC
ncbi:zinc-binding alcohol dehydrogenase family protein [Gracilibacillus sp. HCP3S3_G5_1]|uniref:zinc-binding alcohol dehydrogenase family protein n=1 Tax=unclassified Gracilibacillus TaxID=2625209 RepID=UPI003F897689